MEKTKELFELILKEALNGRYENVFTPDKAGLLVQQLREIGKEKTTLNKICDGNVLAAIASTVIIGDVLASLDMSEDVIPAAISVFVDTYPEDMYFLIGCLSLASSMGLNFEGKEFTPQDLQKSENIESNS